ncbi:Hpt domain-containing protein [Terasakiella pusilla]|uniref:Hpt domain-containing protein n=1 Tax=Terasakiella pusilla TaxID=64973 RepID=UPI003AA98448
MSYSVPNMEDILAEMREKFIETAQEKLDRLNDILALFTSGKGADTALQQEFRREVHSLKGMGGTFQMPLVTELCHTFEAFLEGEDHFDEPLIQASHIYLDRLADLIESGEGHPTASRQEWLHGLPQKPSDAYGYSVRSQPTVLVIGIEEQKSNVIRDNFAESGFACVFQKTPELAFETALKTHPEIVIVNQVLPDMDGAELLRGLGATKGLSKTKFAMICPDRRQALQENLTAVHLLSQKNIDADVMNFIAITLTT